jgi:predicted nucleotidyltransferase
MGAFIARQPNGLLCRFSTVVDTVTDYNLTEEDYIEMCAERERKEASDTIKYNLYPYQNVKDYFVPNNMTEEEFEAIKKEMEGNIYESSSDS